MPNNTWVFKVRVISDHFIRFAQLEFSFLIQMPFPVIFTQKSRKSWVPNYPLFEPVKSQNGFCPIPDISNRIWSGFLRYKHAPYRDLSIAAFKSFLRYAVFSNIGSKKNVLEFYIYRDYFSKACSIITIHYLRSHT